MKNGTPQGLARHLTDLGRSLKSVNTFVFTSRPQHGVRFLASYSQMYYHLSGSARHGRDIMGRSKACRPYSTLSSPFILGWYLHAYAWVPG